MSNSELVALRRMVRELPKHKTVTEDEVRELAQVIHRALERLNLPSKKSRRWKRDRVEAAAYITERVIRYFYSLNY